MSRGVPVAVLVLACADLRAQDCGKTPYDCALHHVGRREFTAALRHLEVQLAGSPRDLKALNLAGIALTGAARKVEANARFRAALAIDPSFSPARKNLAINEFDSGQLASARSHLEAVLKLAPEDEIAHLYLAEILYQDNRHGAALRHYEESGGRFAQNSVSVLHYARSLLAAGRLEEAVAALARLPERDAASLFEAGKALGQAKAHAEAARFFAKARAAAQDGYAAGYNETLMRVEAGDAKGAIRIAEELFAQGRKTSELYNLAARAYASAGRIQEAYDALRAATRLEPAAVENYVDLAMLCVEHANFDLGLEIVDVGLGRQPDSWLLHLQRGVLLAMKAELGQAEQQFETARRLAPEQPAPFAALAMTWMQTGQTEKATLVLRGEAQRRPRDYVVPYIFAVALLRSGLDPTEPGGLEAVAALRASIRAKPDFAPARGELGRLLLKRDDVAGAIQELEKAASLDPSRTAALYALAQAYRKQGDSKKAAELLARVSQLNERERGDDPDAELRKVVVRLVREGTRAPDGPTVAK